jgi:hypothetical protein
MSDCAVAVADRGDAWVFRFLDFHGRTSKKKLEKANTQAENLPVCSGPNGKGHFIGLWEPRDTNNPPHDSRVGLDPPMNRSLTALSPYIKFRSFSAQNLCKYGTTT